MSGYWLPFASCLIGIIGALIALKYGRIMTETHRNYLSVAFIAVLVACVISYGWPSQIKDKLDSIGLRFTDLRERLNANNAAMQAEQQALVESEEWQALEKEIAAVRAELEEAKQSKEGWPSSQIRDKLDSIGLRHADLRKRVNARRDRIGAIAKEAGSIVEERQAIEKEIAAVDAEFKEAKRSKEAREFWRALALIALMPPLLVLGLRSRNWI